jgi:hypothetical protein
MTEINKLVLYREIVTTGADNCEIHALTLCSKNTELFIAADFGTWGTVT